MTVYCPVDDKPYENMELLREHLKKAQAEGDREHIDLIMLEGWDETSLGKPVKKAEDLEET